MKHALLLSAAFLGFVAIPQAQLSFQTSDNLPSSHNSGGCVGIADIDNDGNDDLVILDESTHLYVAYGDGAGNFEETDYGVISGASQWGMTIGDFNEDGMKDVFSGGSYDGVKVQYLNADKINKIAAELELGSMFTQAVNLADIDNDGQLDAFACHDDAESRIWRNVEGNLVPANDMIDMATTPMSDNSGNYGSTWTDVDNDGDIDLFIAKCRQFVSDPNDPRRINALFINDGQGNYTEQALERGLVIYEQSWTSEFQDIDNDGDFDALLTNHSTNLRILENDGNGYFTDITASTGVNENAFFLQCIMKDFDNDGFVDILFSGGNDGLFLNNGDGTFTELEDPMPYTDTMHSFAAGDVNNDGFIDLYASYGNGYVSPDPANPDALWINDGNENNWIAFDLEGVISNVDAVGAKIRIYGDFGEQVREVRAGESYGIHNTFHQHFGIGTFTSVESVLIQWPSGITTVIDNPDVNTYHNLVESECQEGEVSITSDNPMICEGESLDLTANGAESYVWSNGATTEVLNVTSSGTYTVVGFNGECSTMPMSVTVEVTAAPTADISGPSEYNLCDGEVVILQVGSNATDIVWSTNETGNTLEVGLAGSYTATATNECGTVTSEAVVVNVTPTPGTPVIADVTVNTDESATFTGEESTIWYTDENTPIAAGTGTTFTTVPLTETTQYWASNAAIVEDQEYLGGASDFAGGQHHFNSSFWLTFDVYKPSTLKTVKVNSNGEGDRTIQLINLAEEVLQETTVFFPNGIATVEVNFELEPGENYGLRLNDEDPQVWRGSNNDGYAYPYIIGNAVSITGTNITGNNALNRYYFFYDWTIETDYSCESNRIPVTATVGVDGLEEIGSFEVYPNPAQDLFNVSFDNLTGDVVVLTLYDNLGRIVEAKNISGTGLQTIAFDASNWASGMYQLTLRVNGKVSHTALQVH